MIDQHRGSRQVAQSIALVFLLATTQVRPTAGAPATAPATRPATAAAATAKRPEGHLLCQPMFIWAEGKPSFQGTGFFAAAPLGKVVGVSSTHFLENEGPRLTEARWLDVRTNEPVATFTASWGPPGDGGRDVGDTYDLRTDYLLLIASRPPRGMTVLALDARPVPEVGERIWFPNKDGEQPLGHRWVEGKVVEAKPQYVSVQLDEKVELQSQSGSPVLSQSTGKVIGTLSRAGDVQGRTVLILAPTNGMLAALEKHDAFPNLRDVIGGRAPATRPAVATGPVDANTIVQLTEAAAKQVHIYAKESDIDFAKTGHLRVGTKKREKGGGFEYVLDLTDEVTSEDLISVSGGVRIAVDRASAPLLKGTIIDFKNTGGQSGFAFDNPNSK